VRCPARLAQEGKPTELIRLRSLKKKPICSVTFQLWYGTNVCVSKLNNNIAFIYTIINRMVPPAYGVIAFALVDRLSGLKGLSHKMDLAFYDLYDKF
jgi:hypothetical protein